VLTPAWLQRHLQHPQVFSLPDFLRGGQAHLLWPLRLKGMVHLVCCFLNNVKDSRRSTWWQHWHACWEACTPAVLSMV
jgi:hypothetical protein